MTVSGQIRRRRSAQRGLCSLLAIAVATPAFAQTTTADTAVTTAPSSLADVQTPDRVAEQEERGGDIFVTGSRIVRSGFDDLNDSSDDEDDLLDMAWGLTPQSRLSCQVKLEADTDLTIEIPRYTINHAREEH